MTVYGLFNDGTAALNAARLRQLIMPILQGNGALVVDGGVRINSASLNALQVTAGASGLTVNAAAGMCVVPNSTGTAQGGYVMINDATKPVTLTAANGAQPRIDRIVAQVVDTGSASSTYDIVTVTGTAAGSPSAPALPANSLRLAQVLVPAGATLPSQLTITDERVPLALIGRPQGMMIPFTETLYDPPRVLYTGSTFRPVCRTDWFVTHQFLGISVALYSSAADTTGEARIVINGAQWGVTKTIPANSITGVTWVTLPVGVNVGSLAQVEVEVRRTAGTGSTGARVQGAYGFYAS